MFERNVGSVLAFSTVFASVDEDASPSVFNANGSAPQVNEDCLDAALPASDASGRLGISVFVAGSRWMSGAKR